MRRFPQILNNLQKSNWFDIAVIAFFSILAHGLMINWLGFYTDDWTFLWTYSRYGSEGLTNYFSTNRPIWGLFYQITMPILGIKPFTWHLFTLIWGMITSLALYGVVRLVWPNRQRFAVLSGILFAVFPGFILQPIAITFGHIYLIYAIFLLSLFCTAKALTAERGYVGWTALSLLLSAVNLLAMEYFYTLETVRIVLIMIIRTQRLSIREKIPQIIKDCLPYAALFILVTVWRIFFFEVQTFNYDFSLVESIKQNLPSAIVDLGRSILISLYNSAVVSWVQPFIEVFRALRPTAFFSILMLLMGIVFMGSGMVLWLYKEQSTDHRQTRKSISTALAFGIAGLLTAGWPFYMTSLAVIPEGFQSRFLLPFMLGAAILLAALIELIPNQIIRAAMAGLIISGSVGYHVLTQNDFRYVTLENNRLVSQLTTRVPGLPSGTTILSDEGSEFFTITTLTAQLNLIYEPLDDSGVNYGWVFPRNLTELTSMPIGKDADFNIGLVTATFVGNTDSIVSIQQPAGGCLRVLSMGAEIEVPELKEYKVSGLSKPELILQGNQQNPRLQHYYRDLPAENWCTIYQQAELAAQFQDYPEVMRLYDRAIEADLAPSDPSEWVPFIQAFAINGKLPVAHLLTGRILHSRDGYTPYLCRIWRGTNYPANNRQILREINLQKIGCVRPELVSKE